MRWSRIGYVICLISAHALISLDVIFCGAVLSLAFYLVAKSAIWHDFRELGAFFFLTKYEGHSVIKQILHTELFKHDKLI